MENKTVFILLVMRFRLIVLLSILLVCGKAFSVDHWPSYGPTFPEHFRHYHFTHAEAAFGSIHFEVLNHYSSEQLYKIILKQVRRELRPHLERVLPIVFDLSELYQVDPIWVLAVMWTEGHFRLHIHSEAGALGPMQLMPGTARTLLNGLPRHILNNEPVVFPFKPQAHRSYSKHRSVLDPAVNIELGIFYLKYLLDYFKGNFAIATCAYNQGIRGRYSYRYLTQVKRYYHILARPLSQEYVLLSK